MIFPTGLHRIKIHATIAKIVERVRKYYEIFRKASIFDDRYRCHRHFPVIDLC